MAHAQENSPDARPVNTLRGHGPVQVAPGEAPISPDPGLLLPIRLDTP